MNPHVDLGSLRRPSTPPPASVVPAPAVSAASAARPLVAPPRRIFTRYVVPLLLLAGFLMLGAYSLRGSLERAVPVQVVYPVMLNDSTAVAAPVTNAPAAENATPLFQAPGWIEPAPFPTILTALTSGNVKNVKVLEGEAVAAGAVVAELVDDEHALEVKQAESNLALKKAQLQAAQSDWENPIALKEAVASAQAEGQRLVAEKARLQTMAGLAGQEAKAGQSLSRSGYEAGLENVRRQAEAQSSREALQETEARIAANKATLDAATARLELRIEDRQRLETAKAEVQQAQAMLAQAKLRHDRCWITAPQDGVIMELFAKPGTMISPDVEGGMQIASMYNPQEMQVRVDVPSAEAAKIRTGLRAKVYVEAVPGKVYEGRLTRVVPQADVQRNILPVKVLLDNPDEHLRPELLAKVEFFEPPTEGKAPEGKAEQESARQLVHQGGALAIPGAAVQQAKDGDGTIWTVDASGSAVQRQVKLGPEVNDLRVVQEGLQLPDRVIVTNLKALQPGTQVKIVEESKEVASGTH